MRKNTAIASITFLLLANISIAGAESVEINYNLGEVLVSATKTKQYQGEVGSSTTVITSDALKKKGKSTFLEVLREVPGISIVQYGSFGGGASLYLRGSKPGHTLVMIDGVEMNDPMATDRSFDFGNLLVDNIERIEIVRGPQSTLYGSDAIGGVINIVTKKGKGDLKWAAFFEGGSYNTFKEKLGLSGSSDKIDYSLSVFRMDSDGTSKTANTDTDEDDGYENTTLSAKLGYKILDHAKLDVVFRHTDAKYDYDDGAGQDDPNKTGWWKNLMGSIAVDQAINDMWDHKLAVSYSKTTRKYLDEADEVDTTDNSHNWYVGEMKKFSWQHNFYPVDWSTLTGGAEYEEERGFSDGRASWNRFDRKTAHNAGYYLQNQFKLWGNLYITPGFRVDDHEIFGGET
ncbi:MAG: TonB-dependent receptor, partial [Candidatus Heimdallarchaeota archaeon]|nr:TonB-dependent receptor [Candidatus Heimdallarchaeota archaeon]